MTFHLRLTLVFSGIFFGISAAIFAQEQGKATTLFAGIAKAHNSGMLFKEVAFFAQAKGNRYAATLVKETLLRPLEDQISGAYQSHPDALSLTLHSNEGKAYTLEMMRAYPVSEDAGTGYIDFGGRHVSSMDPGIHYQGIVTGEGRSLAALSLFANGDVMLLFANAEGNFIVGKLEDGSGEYILYNDRDMRERPPASCIMEKEHPFTGQILANAKITQLKTCNKLRVYWEVGYGLYAFKSSNLILAQNYILGLFNEFQTLYAADGIAVELTSMYVWTVPEDYSNATTSVFARQSFATYWNIMGEKFDADIGHLLTRTGNNLGGNSHG